MESRPPRAPRLLASLVAIFSLFVAARPALAEVLPGVEVLVRTRAAELAGKRVGILTNPTGVDRKLNSTIDLVRALPDVKVVRLFAPEHGVRGGFYAGDKVDETRDPVSGIEIASLYGKTRRPTPAMLAGLDLVLYDIQDVGVRHYTFVSSLTYLMEECEKAGVEVWVLDRPEPSGGVVVGGPMLDRSLISFIGIHDVPLVYGMTPGEWARMIHAERTPKLGLKIVKMSGWRRGTTYGELGWPWVPPSQHIPRWETSLFYAMTGAIGENSDVSVGVGYTLPFETLGAPWMNGVEMAKRLAARALPGVMFRAATFSPRYGAFTGKPCSGFQIHLTDAKAANPPEIQLAIMAEINALHGDRKLFKGGADSLFPKALGDAAMVATIVAGGSPEKHRAKMEADLRRFAERRAKYLLYD